MSTLKGRSKWPKPAREFGVPIYGGRLYLLKSRAAFSRSLAHLKVDPDAKASSALVAGCARSLVNSSTGARIYLVGWYDGSLITLTHELTHVALFVLEDVGIDARNDAGEVLCYLQSALLRECGVK